MPVDGRGEPLPYGQNQLFSQLQSVRKRSSVGFWNSAQNFIGIFCISAEKTIDKTVTDCYTVKARATKASVCVEAGDCSCSEVTSVEYVRHRVHSRCAIGRLKPIRAHAYIAGTAIRPALQPVLFSDLA